jgi:TPR repeat protein
MGMYNVGYCCQYGKGVDKDIRKAKEWYAKAAAQGQNCAQTQLDSLNAILLVD